jgi:hypothetical protein
MDYRTKSVPELRALTRARGMGVTYLSQRTKVQLIKILEQEDERRTSMGNTAPPVRPSEVPQPAAASVRSAVHTARLRALRPEAVTTVAEAILVDLLGLHGFRSVWENTSEKSKVDQQKRIEEIIQDLYVELGPAAR